MNSAFDELKQQLKDFGKKANMMNEMHNDFIYKGKPLLQNFDSLLNETIELSQKLYSDINKLKDIAYNPNATKQKKQEYETMQYDFFKFIDQVQDIQTKIIERKKENLRSYNKSLHQRQRSQISGLRSQMSLGTNNNLGESKIKDKSFTTGQHDKSESFVRFSNQNSESTPNNRLMYQESGGSSMLDEESSAQEYSDLDLSGDPLQDFDKIQKKAETTEHEINDQLSKLNLMKEIHNMIKREQDLKEQQEEEEKKKYHSFSSGISSHANSMNITTNIPAKNQNTMNQYKTQQSMANNTTVLNQQNTIVASNTSDTVYVKMADPHNESNDQGTSYEQSKRKKYWIILIVFLLIGLGVGLGLGLKG